MVPYPEHVAQLLRRAYYASVSFTDWNLGQMLGSLSASGVEENTVVVMHADHVRDASTAVPRRSRLTRCS
jgi:arylsulfatase A-like enzyme